MSVKDGPGEGTWSVFASKVVEERDAALERLREAEKRADRLEAALLDAALVHAKLVEERDEARKDRERSTDWYQQRFNRLRQWVKEEVEPLSEDVARRYFAICANGSPSPHESADWRETLHGLSLERDSLRAENDALRAKVRTITEQYKPGWVDGLKAVARNEGFDPDNTRHDGVDPPSFIQDVIEALRRSLRRKQAENELLRTALEDIREWAKHDDVIRFDDGDIPLADYCARALHGGK